METGTVEEARSFFGKTQESIQIKIENIQQNTMLEHDILEQTLRSVHCSLHH
jgi:hypothetical protein